jgi:glutamyl-tRNA reductase
VTRGPLLWAAVAAADRYTVAQRESFSAGVAEAALTSDPSVAVIETCHRVEVVGTSPAALPATLEGRARPLADDEAVRHVLRLACGLESAVPGEDQVLHQVRATLADLRERGGDPVLIRLFEVAVGAGRRARTGVDLPQRNLGEVAVRWLEARGAVAAGSAALVVGTGRMARVAVSAFARRGARVAVASRTPDRAAALAAEMGAASRTAADAAVDLAHATAVVVATRGTWPLRATGEVTVVDLSVPRAIPADAVAALGDRFADVDRLWADATLLDGRSDAAAQIAAYRQRAKAIVDEAGQAFLAWRAGRASVATLRALREGTERRRAEEVQRLLRQLPALDDRERRLVEAFSERLVAGVLHRPSTALREDVDGSAADAATRLFGL